jgi:serine O-acetyltransferase
MFENIKEDIKVVYNEKGIKNYIKALCEHSVHIVLLFRLGSYCDKKIPIIGKILRFIIEYLIRILYSSDISCKARIGKGFRIMHGHDIVIGANVIIGDYCKIFNGVTFGNKNTEVQYSSQPILDNNVIVSTGAKILGGITIGKNSIIGANSVVLKDIPKNVVAVGIPAKIIKNEN